MSRLIVVLCVLLPVAVSATAAPEHQVLAREALWLKAIDARDASTLATILDDGFVHINYKGHVEGKAAMLARVGAGVSFEERTSDHTVTLAGPVAIVHGLNTIIAGGRAVARLRYTDVYVLRGSVWKAISAQETSVEE